MKFAWQAAEDNIEFKEKSRFYQKYQKNKRFYNNGRFDSGAMGNAAPLVRASFEISISPLAYIHPIFISPPKPPNLLKSCYTPIRPKLYCNRESRKEWWV